MEIKKIYIFIYYKMVNTAKKDLKKDLNKDLNPYELIFLFYYH